MTIKANQRRFGWSTQLLHFPTLKSVILIPYCIPSLKLSTLTSKSGCIANGMRFFTFVSSLVVVKYQCSLLSVSIDFRHIWF